VGIAPHAFALAMVYNLMCGEHLHQLGVNLMRVRHQRGIGRDVSLQHVLDVLAVDVGYDAGTYLAAALDPSFLRPISLRPLRLCGSIDFDPTRVTVVDGRGDDADE